MKETRRNWQAAQVGSHRLPILHLLPIPHLLPPRPPEVGILFFHLHLWLLLVLHPRILWTGLLFKNVYLSTLFHPFLWSCNARSLLRIFQLFPIHRCLAYPSGYGKGVVLRVSGMSVTNPRGEQASGGKHITGHHSHRTILASGKSWTLSRPFGRVEEMLLDQMPVGARLLRSLK